MIVREWDTQNMCSRTEAWEFD